MLGRPRTAAALAALALVLFSRAQDSGPGFITACKPGYYALTFDDGPSNNTGKLLDELAAAEVKVTFFVLGKSLTPETIAFTRRAHNEGHQIASHTWDHKSLNTLNAEEIKDEMLRNDAAIKNITGVVPNYMRPPFGDCNAQCASTLSQMGYHVVQWNIDSNDWRYETTPQNWGKVSEDLMRVEDDKTNVTNSPQTGYVSLQHDTLSFSVDQVPQIIQKIKSLGLQIAPVEQCLADPPAPMYRGGEFSSNSSTTTVPTNSTMAPSDAAAPLPQPSPGDGEPSPSVPAPSAASPSSDTSDDAASPFGRSVSYTSSTNGAAVPPAAVARARAGVFTAAAAVAAAFL